jgi:hypothetical protein
MCKYFATLIVFLFAMASLPAQQPKAQSLEKWEFFGGYSLFHAYDYPQMAPVSMNGGQAAVTYFPTKYLGFGGEFSAFANGTQNELISSVNVARTVKSQEYLFGPTLRFGLRGAANQRVSFFVHQYFGVSHLTFATNSTSNTNASCENAVVSCSVNPFEILSGGGIDLKVSKHIALRPVQFDYSNQEITCRSLGDTAPGVDSSCGTYGGRGFRYTTGAAFRF